MRTDRRLFVASLVLAAGLPLGAAAQGAQMEVPMLDPWVPPGVREKVLAPSQPLEGAALRSSVERKLRARFEAAARDGRLSREQAHAAGLGQIARHFEAIDRRGAGTIAFEDYKRFLKDRGARLD